MPIPNLAKKKRSTKKVLPALPVSTDQKENARHISKKTNTVSSTEAPEIGTPLCRPKKSKASSRRKGKNIKSKRRSPLVKATTFKRVTRKIRTTERKSPNLNFARVWPSTNPASQSEFLEIETFRQTNPVNSPNLLTPQFRQYKNHALKQTEHNKKNMEESKKHLENDTVNQKTFIETDELEFGPAPYELEAPERVVPQRKIDPYLLSPFQCLLIVYAVLILEEDSDQKTNQYKKIVEEFCKKLLSLKNINDRNCFNKREECERLRKDIHQLGYQMLSPESPELSKSHAVLQDLKHKVILAYILYIESQEEIFCNHTEFAVPITTLILKEKPKNSDILISKDKLQKLLAAVDANIEEIYNFLKDNNSYPNIKNIKPKVLASLIISDITELFKEKGLLEIQAYNIRLK